MNVKRFVADSMQSALRDISRDLGADAVIISSKKVSDGIEVVAAVNYQPGDEQRQAAEVEQQVTLQRELDQAKKLRDQAATSTTDAKAPMDEYTFGRPARRSASAGLTERGDAELLQQASRAQQALAAHQQQPQSFSSAPTNSAKGQWHGQPLVDPQVDPVARHVDQNSQASQARMTDLDTSLANEFDHATDLTGTASADDDHARQHYQARLGEMQDELRELKNWMVSHQGSAWDTQRPLTWRQSQLWQRCQDMGIDASWADQIASQIEDQLSMADGWAKVLNIIANDLPLAPAGIMERGGRFAVVGPTGAGKTTTVGKLAAQFCMRHGPSSVAFITLDNYRVAAHDQLRAFAKILGVDLHTVGNPTEYQQALKNTAKKRLVLVDSAGLASQDPNFTEQLSMLKQSGSSLQKLLVLPLTSQARCLQENYEQFQSAGLTGCVFTKLDECFSLGPGMSIAALAKLPLTLVTDGPHIPDDIHYPDARRLVNLAEQMARMTQTRWQATQPPTPEHGSFHHGA